MAVLAIQRGEVTGTGTVSTKSELINSDSLRRQLQLEHEGITAGIQSYRDRLTDSHSQHTAAGSGMMSEVLEPLTSAIKGFMVPCRGAARQTEVRQFLERLKVCPEELAYITLKHCLQALSNDVMLQGVAVSLASAVMDQHEYARFKKANPRYLSTLEEHLKAGPQHKRRRIIMLKKRQRGLEDEHHEQEELLLLGCKLIELCIEATGLVRRVLLEDRYYLRGTEEAHRRLEATHERLEVMTPLCLPMVVPPKDWAGVQGGGYYSNGITLKHKLLKTRNKQALADLEQHHMPKVYEALNTIQGTAWRINKRVFKVLQTLWTEGSTLAGLPSHEERDKSKRTATAYKLRTAERFLEEKAVFFPHVLDWRGRVYPLPNQLHPQADDIGKGLLQFAEGKAIGLEGIKWLKIHLANTYGVDKVSFKERLEWTEAHREEILQAASSPFGLLRLLEQCRLSPMLPCRLLGVLRPPKPLR